MISAKIVYLFRRIGRALGAFLHFSYSRYDPTGYARWLGVRMGEGVKVYGRVNWGTEPCLIRLGKRVHVTNECIFVTHDGGTLILRHEVPDLELTAPITVGDDVYIGIRSILLPGITIGRRCIIGAGSVVTRDIPDNSVVAGSPARVLKTVDQYLEKAKRRSLHLGHLHGAEKLAELRKHFNV